MNTENGKSCELNVSNANSGEKPDVIIIRIKGINYFKNGASGFFQWVILMIMKNEAANRRIPVTPAVILPVKERSQALRAPGGIALLFRKSSRSSHLCMN